MSLPIPKRPYSLIVVDDSEDIVNMILEVFDAYFSEDFEVQGFIDPIKAKAYIDENAVDAVVSDLVMPSISGTELMEYCHSLSRGIHFYILTGNATFSRVEEAFHKGATGYLLKPIEIPEIQRLASRIRDSLDSWVSVLEKFKKGY